MKIIILGAGLVGTPMAIDLAKDRAYRVSVADFNDAPLKRLERDYAIPTIRTDLSDPDRVTALVQAYDLVISAVPGFMGFRTLEAIIKAGKNVVDIAFFAEDPFQLDDLAKRNNVVALVDCGVAPGASHMLVGHANALLEHTEDVSIFVGGLPERKDWPYEYKAVFSPIDVVEEYTRPARYRENGQLVVKPALSDRELREFAGIGTLEAFNSDGLRTLLKTIDAPNMREKTLRYPGHVELMAILRETGFFSQDEVEVNGTTIRPIDLTARLLFPKWKLEEGEVDITVMRVLVQGKKGGKTMRYTYELYDRYDKASQTHSMARTTGYTATVAARMLMDGLYQRTGVSAPEFIGEQPRCVEYMLTGLGARGVTIRSAVDTMA